MLLLYKESTDPVGQYEEKEQVMLTNNHHHNWDRNRTLWRW